MVHVYRLLKAVSNEIRLQAMRLLRDRRKLRFGDLASYLDVSPEKLAFHLRQLKEAGIVVQEGDYYTLSTVGLRVLEIVDALSLETNEYLERPVLLASGISIPLREYLSSLIDLLCKPGTHRKLKNNIMLDSLSFIEKHCHYSYIPEHVVKLAVLSATFSKGCTREEVPVSIEFSGQSTSWKEKVDVDLLARVGLLEPLERGILLFDAKWSTGVKALYLGVDSMEDLRLLARYSRLYDELVLSPSADRELISAAVSLLGDRVSLTLYLDYGEDAREALSGFLEGSLPSPGTLFQIRISDVDSLGEEDYRLFSKMFNSGFPLVFSFQDQVISGGLFSVPTGGKPWVHLGAATFVLPVLYRSLAGIEDPMVLLEKVLEKSGGLINELKRRTTLLTRVLGGRLSEASYAFQFCYAGYEAALLQERPEYVDALGSSTYRELLVRGATGFITTLAGLAASPGDVHAVHAYFSPSPHLATTARVWRSKYPEYVNDLSPFVYNAKTGRTPKSILQLESALHGSGGLVSVPEIRFTSLSPADMLVVLKAYAKRGLRTVTFTKTSLYHCTACGHVFVSKALRCPKCLSTGVEQLVRVKLVYRAASSVGPDVLAETASRPVVRSVEELLV
ncbi:ArsR family transcriptional regulator [Thermofilum pendens]|uniref:Transcriptional regulator, HxlR family n=1 Tax=Thermofilum pendens (strain DSM 2475 / Hrk 5) TaxID=368408 RepID=A1RXM8_THEPD|nr:ArsR family transcriptional regulator [Thermofilum pendens]ABL77958.1 transcriptional regulator, HxlR family [Thermofilum pendens Hrk 5]